MNPPSAFPFAFLEIYVNKINMLLISNMDLEDVSWQNSHIINQSVPECARVPCIQNHAISIYRNMSRWLGQMGGPQNHPTDWSVFNEVNSLYKPVPKSSPSLWVVCLPSPVMVGIWHWFSHIIPKICSISCFINRTHKFLTIYISTINHSLSPLSIIESPLITIKSPLNTIKSH